MRPSPSLTATAGRSCAALARPGRLEPAACDFQPGPTAASSHARPALLRRRRPALHSTVPRGILDSFRAATASSAKAEKDDDEEEGDALGACPLDCVMEIQGAEGDGVSAFDAALAAAGPTALVVVDFYKTACGACRYIAPGFVKLCKKAGKMDGDGGANDDGEQPDIVFLKHNVLDEEGGRSELAVREGVRAVPTFYFYRGGEKLESFPTRDRAVVAAAVNRLVGREVL